MHVHAHIRSPCSHTSFRQARTDQLASATSFMRIGLSCFFLPPGLDFPDSVWHMVVGGRGRGLWTDTGEDFLENWTPPFSYLAWLSEEQDFHIFVFSWKLWVWDAWISFAKAAGNRTGVNCPCQAPWIAGKWALAGAVELWAVQWHNGQSCLTAGCKHWTRFKLSLSLSFL